MASWKQFYRMDEPIVSSSEIIAVDAYDFFRKINPDTGHFCKPDGTSTLVTPEEGLDISAHKQCEFVGRVLTNDYMARALKSVSAVMPYQNSTFIDGTYYSGEDGSFPGQKKGSRKQQGQYHNKIIFFDAAAQLVAIARSCDFNSETNHNLLSWLTDRIAVTAHWALHSQDTVDFLRETNTANQLISATTFMHKAGKLTADPELLAAAKSWMERIFEEHVTTDGVFVEKTGFDFVYQTVSLEGLADYYMKVPRGSWKDEVGRHLQGGINRALACVNVDTGVIDDTGWTRTKEKTPRQPGMFAVDYDRDITALRFKYWNYLGMTGPKSATLNVIADRILNVGQSFTHISKGS
jgi:hypothetical protein